MSNPDITNLRSVAMLISSFKTVTQSDIDGMNIGKPKPNDAVSLGKLSFEMKALLVLYVRRVRAHGDYLKECEALDVTAEKWKAIQALGKLKLLAEVTGNDFENAFTMQYRMENPAALHFGIDGTYQVWMSKGVRRYASEYAHAFSRPSISL